MRCKNFLLVFTLLCAIIIGGCTDDTTTQPPQQTSTEPTNHPTAFKAASGTDSSITLTWTDAIGEVIPENYVIIGTEHPAVPERPIDGVPPVAGSMTKTVSKGVQTVIFTGLKQNQQYNFAIFPYTGSGEKINYKITGSFTIASGITLKKEDNFILPLKVGNRWNYKTFHIDYETGTTDDADQDFTIEVITDTTIEGSQWFKVRNLFLDDGSVAIVQNRSDGLWRKITSSEYLTYKYPVMVNTKFMSGTTEVTVVSTFESVTVARGTFTCYNYSEDVGDALEHNIYMTPKIGIIRVFSKLTDPTGDVGISKELQSYILK